MKSFSRTALSDELQVGDTASLVRIVGRDDIDLFAAVSGDANPSHLDAAFAVFEPFRSRRGSRNVDRFTDLGRAGNQAARPGTVYLKQDLKFHKPVSPGDTVTATVTVKEKRPENRIVLLDTVCTNERRSGPDRHRERGCSRPHDRMAAD